MNREKSKEIRFIRITFYILFSAIAIFAVIIPHLVHDTYFLSENFAQSLALVTVFVIGYVFYGIYNRKIKEIQEKEQQLERRLINSYAYIGKANNTIELAKKFMNFSLDEEADSNGRKIFLIMLSNMINTILKSNEALMRFIDETSGKTVRDFLISSRNKTPKISNRKLLNSEFDYLRNISIVESNHKAPIRCFLVFPEQKHAIDHELLKALLGQAHLLFLADKANRFDSCENC